MKETENTIDQGGLLEAFCRNGFDGSVEETALVLGRTPEEIEGILSGGETLDEDLEMKLRGIAQERNIDIL